MKIVIAPDSFKGSLTAVEAVEAMTCGVLRAVPDAEILKMPLADGGEGTVDVLVTLLGGVMCECDVKNPLGGIIRAKYGMIKTPRGVTAVVEVAEASGLTLVAETERNALKASSYGTGQLIKDALDKGCRDFIIGLGGSATTDAGKGLLEALGVKFYDEHGEKLSAGGESLRLLSRIDVSGMDRRIKESRFMVMCDVENPLYGENGAAYVFSPQKGATPDEVILLDDGLRRFADCVKIDLEIDVSQLRGGGAAGGLGAALIAFCEAKLESGAELILKISNFDKILDSTDLVLTGEGKMDRQTMMGKLLSCVLRKASSYNVPVVAFAGMIDDKDMLLDSGFKDVCCINSVEETWERMMNKSVATNNLSNSVFNFLKRM